MAFRIINMIEDDLPDRTAFSFNQLEETGLLWYINRALLNPRGFAMALNYADGEKEPRGWSIVSSDGPITIVVNREHVGWKVPTYDDPITVTIDDDFERLKFNMLEKLLMHTRIAGRCPLEDINDAPLEGYGC